MGKLFGESSDKKRIAVSVAAAIIITVVFGLVEFISDRSGLYTNNRTLYLIDSVYRMIFGIIATIVLFSLSQRSFRDIYFGKIPRVTRLLLLPVYVYLFSLVDVLIRADRVTFEYVLSFAACVLQQIATGFFEETLYRGVVMSPFRPHYSEKKWRIEAVLTSGMVFGFAHAFNFIFYRDMSGTLDRVFMTMIWGMFIAAIYMISDNLLLVMAVHAIWDIFIHLPGFFFDPAPGSSLYSSIGDDVRIIVHPIILCIMAIVICSKADSISN